LVSSGSFSKAVESVVEMLEVSEKQKRYDVKDDENYPKHLENGTDHGDKKCQKPIPDAIEESQLRHVVQSFSHA